MSSLIKSSLIPERVNISTTSSEGCQVLSIFARDVVLLLICKTFDFVFDSLEILFLSRSTFNSPFWCKSKRCETKSVSVQKGSPEKTFSSLIYVAVSLSLIHWSIIAPSIPTDSAISFSNLYYLSNFSSLFYWLWQVQEQFFCFIPTNTCICNALSILKFIWNLLIACL